VEVLEVMRPARTALDEGRKKWCKLIQIACEEGSLQRNIPSKQSGFISKAISCFFPQEGLGRN